MLRTIAQLVPADAPDKQASDHSLPTSTLGQSLDEAQAVVKMPSSSPETSALSQSRVEGGHILAERSKDNAEDPLSSNLEKNALNGKLLQLLERRKAKESDTIKKMEEEHAAAIHRKEKLHMEQLDLMDAAHTRIVQHLEAEMERLRNQLTNAVMEWERADEEMKEMKTKLASEIARREEAERVSEELNKVLEAELID